MGRSRSRSVVGLKICKNTAEDSSSAVFYLVN
jgi:hypothetical protein